MGHTPASLPTCLNVNGPTQRVYTERVHEQSSWLHHRHPNHSKRAGLKEDTVSPLCAHINIAAAAHAAQGVTLTPTLCSSTLR